MIECLYTFLFFKKKLFYCLQKMLLTVWPRQHMELEAHTDRPMYFDLPQRHIALGPIEG